MSRIELPSGAWVDVKDKTSPGDYYAVLDAPDTVIEDGQTTIRNAAGHRWKTLMGRLITGWSYPVPIPSESKDPSGVLDEYPDDLDDLEALQDALQPRMERIVGSRRSPNSPKPPAQTNGTSPG